MGPARMLKLVRSIVSVIVRRYRRRVVLDVENLALRHQLHVLRRRVYLCATLVTRVAGASYPRTRLRTLGTGRQTWCHRPPPEALVLPAGKLLGEST